MARSAINDPLEKFRFIVSWLPGDVQAENTLLTRAGFHDIQMPKRTTTKIHYREGVDPDISSISAGLNTMEDVVLSRGVIPGNIPTTNSNEFYKWMSAVHNPTKGAPGALPGLQARPGSSASPAAAADNYRKDIQIQMLDREGKIARQWILYNAFPVHFVPGSDLNAGEDADKSLESLTLAYEDFQEMDPAPGSTVVMKPSSSL